MLMLLTEIGFREFTNLFLTTKGTKLCTKGTKIYSSLRTLCIISWCSLC